MERTMQVLSNRLSYALIGIATLILGFFLNQNLIANPVNCINQFQGNPPPPHFPKSSCELNSRNVITIDQRNKKVWSNNDWKRRVESFVSFFRGVRNLGFLGNDSKVLCVSAGVGHEVKALMEIGVGDVTGVEIVDSPPLVSRSDPHNLPFNDDVFDVVFSAHLDESLFPSLFVYEMERTVKVGGISVLVVDQCSGDELGEIKSMFHRSKFLDATTVTLIRMNMTRIVMMKQKII